VFWFKTTKKQSMAAAKLGLFSKKVAAAAFVGGCHFSMKNMKDRQNEAERVRTSQTKVKQTRQVLALNLNSNEY